MNDDDNNIVLHDEDNDGGVRTMHNYNIIEYNISTIRHQ